ncbi:MAG: hypothetical protein ACRDR6_00685 [Pseudonocardiaceae bacterium]
MTPSKLSMLPAAGVRRTAIQTTSSPQSVIEAIARAMDVMINGVTLANIIDVPTGAALGQVLGWQDPFWVLTDRARLPGGLVQLVLLDDFCSGALAGITVSGRLGDRRPY